MATACEIDDTNEETTYAFRFGTTNKVIHLNEQQVNGIPYLSAIITHKNDFSSIENENGEYVLNSRIRYNWFMPIFQSITMGHPSALFTELSQEANVWGMLQLYDYLCINPISVPLLKDQNLVRSNSDNIDEKKLRVEYIRANNRLEVRDTAAQFIIALTKNEYNLDDSNTLESIFSLIMAILSNPNVFGVRLCHHTSIIVKKLCFSLFSYTQQRELQKAERSIQNIKTHSLIYLHDGHQTLPTHFQNVYAWKGMYVPMKEGDSADYQSTCNQKSTNFESSLGLNFWNRYLFIEDRNTDFNFTHFEFNNFLGDTSPVEYFNSSWLIYSESVSYS